MQDKDIAAISFGDTRHESTSEKKADEDKRRYNREFMRRWRSDPFHRALERAKRRQRYHSRQKQSPRRNIAKNQNPNVCGFCWRRPAVSQIARLQMRDGGLPGYVQVRIPYCGEC